MNGNSKISASLPPTIRDSESAKFSTGTEKLDPTNKLLIKIN